MIYLAMPYTCLTPEQREYYFAIGCKIAAILFNECKHVFVPICFAHPIATRHSLPANWHFWAEFNEKMLSVCDELWVLTLPGWKNSYGINEEIKIANRLGINIKYVDPVNFGIVP